MAGKIPDGSGGRMAINIGRRQFISTFVGTAFAWPLAARAHQPAMPVVGFVHGGAADAFAGRIAAFRAGLGEAGYVEGQNVVIEYHWLEGHFERLPAVLEDPIRRRVTVIATHELLPKATRFAVLINPADAPSANATSKALEQAARTLGLDIRFFNASTPVEIDAASAGIARESSDTLFIASEGFFASRRASQFATLAIRDRVPASFATSEMVEAGLLMSYGVNIADTFRQVGNYVGRILKGEKPADLPVQQPTTFQFAINMKTAKTLGLEVPPMLLARADEVIE
jgi:putative ABC transport system substrate-binding protein